jgi:glutathione S-transferase
MLTLYDADRCPYAARVRITLAEKEVPYQVIGIDLENRPAILYEKNPKGKVPVLEEDGGFVLPESAVIMAYLDERFPEPPLLPADAAERAAVRLFIHRFDDFSAPYYDLRRGGSPDAFDAVLTRLDALLERQPFLTGRDYGLADIAYVPWILRARSTLGVDLHRFPELSAWLERLLERPAVAGEAAVVAAL